MTPQERQLAVYGAAVIITVVVIVVLKNAVKEFRKNLAEASPERDASQLAVRFFQAIDGFGTDEAAIFQLARESRGIFSKVAANYKARYGQALDQALAEDLNAAELQQFYSILKS